MTPEDIVEVVERLRASGDDDMDVEAKRCGQSTLPKSMRETFSAFANARGGLVLLGVDQSSNFTLSGVDKPGKLMSDLASAATDMTPPLRPRIGTVEVDGKSIVYCDVDEVSTYEKPCYTTSLGISRGSFLRVHDGDQHLTEYEIQMLMSSRGQPKNDREKVEGAKLDDLDEALVEPFCNRLRVTRPGPFAKLDNNEILLRNSVIVLGDGDEPIPTVAGIIAMGKFPQQFFPQLNITFVHYPTKDGDDPTTGTRFLDNVPIDGAIPTLVTEALRVLRRNMSRRATISGSGRADTWEYPETALREAIVNACAHRDLSAHALGTQVQVEMYPDRLCVRNPGGLYGPVTEEQLGQEGVSSARNAVLLRILEDITIPGEDRTVCENRGSGIRAMINALRGANMSLPLFQNRVSSFEVTFPNHALLSDEMVAWLAGLNEDNLSNGQHVALATMRGGVELNNETYRKLTGVDSRVATSELGDLVGRELVTQSGSRRWATYRIADRLSSNSFSSPSRRLAPADRRDEILEAMGDNELSRREIERLTNLTSQVVSRWLSRLRTDGLVELVGGAKPQSKNVKYRRVHQTEPQNEMQGIFDFPET